MTSMKTTTTKPKSKWSDPSRDCPLCPRLVDFRTRYRASDPEWFNAPVPAFGGLEAKLLIVGLAPGLKGANRTGRPFTGDYAGDLLYPTLAKYGFTSGTYGAAPDDGLTLVGARITNCVRCVPPENKPTGAEVKACRQFLDAELAALCDLKAIVTLGAVAHGAVLSTLKLKKALYPFGHGRVYELENDCTLHASYHCSRYNTNTGRLTPAMFEQVFAEVQKRHFLQ